MDNEVKKYKNRLEDLNKVNRKLRVSLKSANKLLKETQDKMYELDIQKDEFISMAAHELRAPTTAIKGYVSMILNGDAGEISDRARGYLTDARSTNDRLIRLVNNMINVSQIEKGSLIYQMERVSLAMLAGSVYDDFKFEAERKNLKFEIQISNETDDMVEVDPDRIREVIANLVSNAIKYTEDGFVKIQVGNNGRHVRLEVIDSGPGISNEEQKKLFKKFYRVKSAVGKTIGTGLGLYISQLIVRRFDGKIGLESELGKGSIFWFDLPLK